MSSLSRSPGNLRHALHATRRYATTPRAFALLSGLALVGSFVSVLYHVVDVVGGVSWLFLAVGGSFVLATAFARLVPPRAALGLGLGLLVAGVGVYLLFVPEHHDRVLTAGFFVDLAAYLTGISVLGFLRVDVWAIAVAPGPVFLTWYFVLRHRYDLAALAGGPMLGLFVLTGDAGWTTTLVGSVSVFGVLGFGTLERSGGSWEQAERLGGVVVVGVLAAQALRGTGWGATARTGSGTGDGASTGNGDLTVADGRVEAFDHVTLSPRVVFDVTADESAYWHVDAFDRYTGGGWIRSGRSTAYDGPLPPPAGETTPIRQTFRAVLPDDVDQEGFSLQVMPAAWKPVRVLDGAAEYTQVTATDGLVPVRGFGDGDEYTVVSEVPDADPARLRAAGTTYPGNVRDRYLQVPESTPSRVGRKAREVAGDAATPYDAALAVEEWLEENKEYSWEVDRPGGDLTDAFLFSMDRGYCVYYATAMAVLLRTLGIPARFANGYTPGQRVADDRWVVRGLDSHAWTEVYFPDVGWVSFDPTPAGPRRAVEVERLEQARAEGVAGVDTDETRSENPVSTPVANDTARTPGPSRTADGNGSVESASGSSTTATAAASDANPPVGAAYAERLSTRLARVDRVTLVAALVGGVLGVNRLGLVERGYRALWLRRQPATDSPRADVERAYERLEYLLSRRARPRATGETPRQYLAAVDWVVDRRARRVVQLYESAHYSGDVTREEADEAIRHVDELVGDRPD